MRAAVLCLTLVLVRPVWAQESAPPATAPVEGPRTVRVSAEGCNRDDALRQALRKAVEQGAGALIASFSQGENFVLVRDTIYSRSAGLVQGYRILEEKPGVGGTHHVSIEATVRPSTIAAAWAEVQNVLDQIGRPKILVWIDERIDGEPQPDSIVAARIEELLVKRGFDLVSRQGVAELRQREQAAAADERNAAKLARLAKDAGAQILIRGVAGADRAGVERPYDVPIAMYNCDVQARVYATDTARLLASEALPVTRAGARSNNEFSPQAARAALARATLPEEPPEKRPPGLAERLVDSVMEQWSVQLTGGGDVEIEIDGLDFRGYTALRRALTELDPARIRAVDGDFTKGAALLRLKTTLSSQMLAERLLEKPFEGIEITDVKPGRIQGRARNAP